MRDVPPLPSACAACDDRAADATPSSAPDALGAERRAFLRDAFLAGAAALVALGGTPAEALARPLALVGPIATRETPGAPDGAAGRALTYPIPAADGAQIDRANEVILVRWQGAVYAFNLACPHQNTALRWLERDGRFQCPKHKSKYRPDGVFLEGRATRGMDRLAIRREGATVVVDPDVLHKQDADPQAWAGATVKL